MKRQSSQIPPKGLVRTVGVVLLGLGLAILYVSVVNYVALGWLAIVYILIGITTVGAAAAATYTGDPTWILLDLIFPY